jgi:hypothetical protein
MYVLVKGAAGLGNRVLCFLSAVLYARASGRKLLVDWSDPMLSEAGENAFPELFECPVVHAPPADLAQRSVAPAVWRGRLGLTPTQLVATCWPLAVGEYHSQQLSSIDVARLDYREDVLVLWSWDSQVHRMRRPTDQRGHGRGAPESQILTELAGEYLQPSAAVQERIDEEESDLAGRFIGVHVRSTDRRTPIDKIERALSRRVRNSPSASIRLATDSRAVQERFVQRFPKVHVLNKSFATDGGPLHLGVREEDRRARAVDAVAEMFLLARCQELVYASRSSYAQVARLLSGLPRPSVTDIDARNPALRMKRLVQRQSLIGAAQVRRLRQTQ